jgi:hypothetical protein
MFGEGPSRGGECLYDPISTSHISNSIQGVRGGQDQFTWESVKQDKHRENYLGHSVMAPVGRFLSLTICISATNVFPGGRKTET